MGTEQQRGSAIRRCAQCGTEFSVKNAVARAGNGLYCSRKCWRASLGESVTRKCKVCGVTFVVPANVVKAGKGLYCSRECVHKGRIKVKSKRTKRTKKPQTAKVCPCCGMVFLTDTLARMKKYCSRKCQYAAQRKPVGERKRTPRENSTQLKHWVRSVILRDKACIRCGKKDSLQAHHVKSWKHYPELRYDINNGVALCPHCHHAHHLRLPLEAFTKQGGKTVRYCLVCETAYVQLRKTQQACSILCGTRLYHQRKKACQKLA